MEARRRIQPETPSPLRGPRPLLARFEATEEPGRCEARGCDQSQREGATDGSCERHQLVDAF